MALLQQASQRVTPFSGTCKQSQTIRRASRGQLDSRYAVRCEAAGGGDSQPSLVESLSRGAAALALAATLSLGSVTVPEQMLPPAHAGLTAGDPIKNANALLRNALPINNKSIRLVQTNLEAITEELRVPGSKKLNAIERSVNKAEKVLAKDKPKIIADFAPDKKDAGLAALAGLEASFQEFDAVIKAGNTQAVPIQQMAALDWVGKVEEAMVKGFPFEVPPQYADMPQLKGRATIDMDIKFKEARDEGLTGGNMRIVVDGFNAPVSAGNFVDLVARGFYDNMDVQRADGFVVQFGDPPGPADGFVDPTTGQVRRVPFEVMVEGDKVPVYEETLEDNGRFNEQPVLPFNAFGTLAVARSEFDTNNGSSQMFFLLKESELTPTGSNLLDGRYAVFGYIVDNQNLLKDIKVGDTISSAKVVSGLENLQAPKLVAAAKPSDN